jgi:diguanylate cyclase (GGDEF)-like protein
VIWGERHIVCAGCNPVLSLETSGSFYCWGGEEFAGIFPQTDAETLEAIAERLRIIAAHSRVNTGSDVPTVTVSIGGTVAWAEDSAAVLDKRADTRMYASKTNGLNWVTVAEG